MRGVQCAGPSASAARLRARQRLARQLLFAVRRLADEGGNDYRVLAHVRFLDPLVAADVREMRAGVVLDGVLDELKPGSPTASKDWWSVMSSSGLNSTAYPGRTARQPVYIDGRRVARNRPSHPQIVR